MSSNKGHDPRERNLRAGIKARTTLTPKVQHNQAILAEITAQTTATFGALFGGALSVLVEAGGNPFSTSFGSSGTFSGFTESLTVRSGAAGNFLIKAASHEVGAIGFERLSDLQLIYEGGNLTEVIKEGGATVSLEYTGTQLTKVTNSETGTSRNLSYSGPNLVWIRSEKPH